MSQILRKLTRDLPAMLGLGIVLVVLLIAILGPLLAPYPGDAAASHLARRLKPGLTLEDVRNPHDFPELGDPDWHYEDGVLTGIQSVRTALRACARGA